MLGVKPSWSIERLAVAGSAHSGLAAAHALPDERWRCSTEQVSQAGSAIGAMTRRPENVLGKAGIHRLAKRDAGP
jgi:hypothetical protein